MLQARFCVQAPLQLLLFAVAAGLLPDGSCAGGAGLAQIPGLPPCWAGPVAQARLPARRRFGGLLASCQLTAGYPLLCCAAPLAAPDGCGMHGSPPLPGLQAFALSVAAPLFALHRLEVRARRSFLARLPLLPVA